MSYLYAVGEYGAALTMRYPIETCVVLAVVNVLIVVHAVYATYKRRSKV